ASTETASPISAGDASTRSPVMAMTSGAMAFTRATTSSRKARPRVGPMWRSVICAMVIPSSAGGRRRKGTRTSLTTTRTASAAAPPPGPGRPPGAARGPGGAGPAGEAGEEDAPLGTEGRPAAELAGDEEDEPHDVAGQQGEEQHEDDAEPDHRRPVQPFGDGR